MSTGLRIVEREEGGRAQSSEHGGEMSAGSNSVSLPPPHIRFVEFAAKVFLPAGYPASVSPDYLRYQIFNALQAFCSSLAGLLSSRALLEGFGVGKADASATHALLLTVLQDFFSRVTTICAAYVVGPSLSPEAKTFRLLADVSNDAAIVLDTLSPLFISSALLPLRLPGLRVAALCLSGALRALCGIAAGGSKAALTVHFATPTAGAGDIGDLNAKDSSKETVLALLGMLAGSLIVPYLTTPSATYSVLFGLVGLHLALNYLGIRGVVLRSLNRQRMSIAWDTYRETSNSKFLSPSEVSDLERIFERPGVLRELRTNSVAGRCTIGSSLNQVLRGGIIPFALLDQMKEENYVLWFDRGSLSSRLGGADELRAGAVHLHICLKEGNSAVDQLKAWAHAVEVGRMLLIQQRASFPRPAPAELILAAHRRVEPLFPDFLQGLRNVGWNTADAALLPGSPRALIVSIEPTDLEPETNFEDKKEK
ncbi:vitamin B6 photo-protection and homoeostasis-domain-containing protein [Mycena maculata]|uniref:Vitamin B6 photo-protection and homoeostasis-domain-containing protein n=1 Tax=Mycena maculata TaxID=230809 RepID=A0AAD7IFW0_9AGAR|nr:vitamin B6 photo-protection and homoeostasis-domain-containing protein [Mycena maculata]